MVLLEALQELDGWTEAPSLPSLAERSWQVLQRRRPLLTDLPDTLGDTADGTNATWQRYWRDNPVKAWTGGNQPATAKSFFRIREQPLEATLEPTFDVAAEHRERFAALVQELVDYRLAAYEVRRTADAPPDNVVPFKRTAPDRTELPYFPNLRIACGHFRTARADAEEHRSLGPGHGRLEPARHFIARASGNSMNGGKNPIKDGDYLLLELVSPANAGSITGTTMAIERQDQTGDDQYLLHVVTKKRDGSYVLVANNPDYEPALQSCPYVLPHPYAPCLSLARAQLRPVSKILPIFSAHTKQVMFTIGLPISFTKRFWCSGRQRSTSSRIAWATFNNVPHCPPPMGFSALYASSHEE